MSKFFLGLKSGFKEFSNMITNIVNLILSFFVYVLGIGPVSLVSKAFGKHYLDLKGKGSSWIKKDLRKKHISDYYRMF